MKMNFWPQWPHRDPWPHHLLCMSSGQGAGHFDQVWLKSDVGKYVKKTCCQKKEDSAEKAAETRQIQDPAAEAGRVKKETRKIQKPAGAPAG